MNLCLNPQISSSRKVLKSFQMYHNFQFLDALLDIIANSIWIIQLTRFVLIFSSQNIISPVFPINFAFLPLLIVRRGNLYESTVWFLLLLARPNLSNVLHILLRHNQSANSPRYKTFILFLISPLPFSLCFCYFLMVQ